MESDTYLKRLQLKVVEGQFRNLTKGQLKKPEQLFEIFKSLKDWGQTTVMAIYLTHDMEMLAYDVLFTGTQTETVINLRDLYGHGYMIRADYYILVLNYITGVTKPSEEDKKLIAFLQKQKRIMDIGMLDFMIVGENGYWSMYENSNSSKAHYPFTTNGEQTNGLE